MVKVAINGLGRIGRAFFRLSHQCPDFEVVAVNDLNTIENLAYLLQYDTVYGNSQFDVQVAGDSILVSGKKILCLQEPDPANLPWGDMGVSIVLEATGRFASYEKSKAHIDAGAKRVVISAPVKDHPDKVGISGSTILIGVNDADLSDCVISANASCTTNAVSPLVAVLREKVGIEKALLNTVHAYTASQHLVDNASKDFRRGRSATTNIIPTTTGAAIATTLVHTSLSDKFDGIALRVPVPAGSVVDFTFVSSRDTSVEELNAIFREAAVSEEWREVLATTDKPIVSSDIIGSKYATIVDLSFTRVIGGNLVKILSWYDNEVGYAHTLRKHVSEVANFCRKALKRER